MKAVIYARYSSDRQREESITSQLRICHDFAERNEIEIIGEYCDRAISGRTDHRPEFQKMIHASGKKLFDAVIVYRLDRFALLILILKILIHRFYQPSAPFCCFFPLRSNGCFPESV